MIARLLEANYAERKEAPSAEQIRFWLREMRTARYLIEIAGQFSSAAAEIAVKRPLLQYAIAGEAEALETALAEEQAAEQQRDKKYWQPLLAEIEQLRRAGR